LLRYNQQNSNATFNPVARSGFFFIVDVAKAIMEITAPIIHTTGKNISVSNMRFSAAIIELALVLANDIKINKTAVPSQTDGNMAPINAKLCPGKLFSIFFSVLF